MLIKTEPETVDLTQDFNGDNDDFEDNLFEDNFLDEDFFLEDQIKNEPAVIEEPKPKSSFSYFCQVKREAATSTFASKSFIITLLSKLAQNSAAEWQLKVRLGDGTGHLDASFSNEVLEKIIGFSCRDVQEVKASGDEGEMRRLKEGMAKCQKMLYGMCMLFRIEYDPNEQFATVLDILECTNSKFPHMN